MARHGLSDFYGDAELCERTDVVSGQKTKDRAMCQRQLPSRSGTEGSTWLAMLIDAFERTERLGNVACDEELLSAAKLHLQQHGVSDDCDLPVVPQPTFELHH
jgi:hypothetical protein